MREVLPKKAKLVPKDAKCVFKGVIYNVYQWEQKVFDGTKKTFEMLKRADTVKIIAIKNNKIVIVKQEQPFIGSFIDIPGGMHDINSETELDAAKRELREETGLVCKDWKLLTAMQYHSKIEQMVYHFLAYNVESVIEQKLDSGEKIEVEYLTLEEVKNLFDDPRVRYLPKEILGAVSSVEELLTFPEFK
ncbi:MAG: NUDIX hydrolase [Patescibacteria group bacterium]